MTNRRRRRRTERAGPAGFLVVDKPQGWTSHDVVDAARRWLGTRRVGHLGTLDPLATGVLPLAVREATKLVPFLERGSKVYIGAIRLGEETDTLDADGEVVRHYEGPLPDEASVREAFAAFRGEIEQVPPMFSAVKQDGVPLHRLAREGREVERAPKRVRIDRLELIRYEPPRIELEVACSAGTYVRALAADVGAKLGCGAHLVCLRRTRSEPFASSQAAPAVDALGLPVLRLGRDETRKVLHGAEILASALPLRTLATGSRIAALEPGGELLAVLEMGQGRRLRPLRVLRSLAPPG
jgi:tRNA pseudouridine55 synthase